MASVVEICNRALSNIGNSRSINSLTEASKEAGECSLHFEACRDAVLSDFDWNFATKRVALADTSNPPPDWEYAYQYPSDCLRITEIMLPGVRNPTAAMRVQYEVGADTDGTGKLIYTDLNRPGFPGECFICELRLPDHRFRWKHNKLFLLLP
ncbi:hypothetical protein A1YG_03321, partial [Escherichia coli KTE130]